MRRASFFLVFSLWRCRPTRGVNTEFTKISDVVEKHKKGMSRLYFPRKLRSFSVCAKMMRAGDPN